MTRTKPREQAAAQPLLDLARLVVAVRGKRRLWVACALLGMIAGALLAVLLPTPPTATTRLLVIHEQDQPSDTGSLIRTDAALLTSTTIASAALERLGSDLPPEEFRTEYTATGLTNNVLEIRVEGPTDAEATRRAMALANAFIADHVGRIRAAASARATALLDQRDRIQGELNAVNRAISGAEATSEAQQDGQSNAAALDSLYARRAELTSRVSDLTQQAEEVGIGAPEVAANTQIVDAPRPVRTSILVTGATNAAIGLVLGLAVGVAMAAVTGVVRDRPVLRADIAAHLGASVIAQLPAPGRGPGRPWRRGRAARERARVAATLVRLLRAGPGPVSVLELGSPMVAAALTRDVATGLAADRSVVIVEDLAGRLGADDLPGHRADEPDDAARPIRVVGTEQAADDPPGTARLGLGSVTPGTAWTDLTHLGAETILVVRAGYAHTEWLHTVARQLADCRVPVIGVVLVDPDPRDRTDGTLWDGLHTALRGRSQRPGGPVRPDVGNGFHHDDDVGGHPIDADASTRRFPQVHPHTRHGEHDLPTKRFAPVERGTTG